MEERVKYLEAAVLHLARRLRALEATAPGQYAPGDEPPLGGTDDEGD